MTVGDLIDFLKTYDKDMAVLVKDTDKNAFCLDFVELTKEGAGVVSAKPILPPGTPGRKVYEAESKAGQSVLVLNCKPKVY